MRPRQNGRRFADDTFKRIFLDKNARISIKISLKFVPMGPINNNPALVQIMAWRRPGDKPLSEPMVVSLLTHKCVTRPQWLKKPYAPRFSFFNVLSECVGQILFHESLRIIIIAYKLNAQKTILSFIFVFVVLIYAIHFSFNLKEIVIYLGGYVDNPETLVQTEINWDYGIHDQLHSWFSVYSGGSLNPRLYHDMDE